MKFSSQLKYFIERSGLTRTQLAERVEVSLPYISHLMAGREKPTIKKAGEIAHALSLNNDESEKFIDAARTERFDSETLEWLESQPKVYRIPLISWVKANRFDSISDPFYPGTAENYILTTKGEGPCSLLK